MFTVEFEIKTPVGTKIVEAKPFRDMFSAQLFQFIATMQYKTAPFPVEIKSKIVSTENARIVENKENV